MEKLIKTGKIENHEKENNIFSGSDTEENTIRKIIEQRNSSEPNKPKIIGLYRNYDDVGRFNAIQTNDYFGNKQHVNCVGGVNEAKAKYPMTEVLYEGEIDTHLYNRFMLIGIK